jgi:hypothetical protein
VPRILKKMADRAGVDATRISGHSCRVGMAQDLVSAGAELPALMTAGRWKTATMPARYVEKLAEGRGAMATYKAKLKAKRQGADTTHTHGSAPAVTLAAAAAEYVRAEWSEADGPFSPDGMAAEAVAAFCGTLYIYDDHTADPPPALRPLLDVLGGPEYVRACLQWKHTTVEWSRSRKHDKGPAPQAPAVP